MNVRRMQLENWLLNLIVLILHFLIIYKIELINMIQIAGHRNVDTVISRNIIFIIEIPIAINAFILQHIMLIKQLFYC